MIDLTSVTGQPELELELSDDQQDNLNQQLYLEAKTFFDIIKGLSDAQLGKLVREYTAESQHGSWEGFTWMDQIGVHRMLSDMALYQMHM